MVSGQGELKTPEKNTCDSHSPKTRHTKSLSLSQKVIENPLLLLLPCHHTKGQQFANNRLQQKNCKCSSKKEQFISFSACPPLSKSSKEKVLEATNSVCVQP
jgi:hypothetical protein